MTKTVIALLTAGALVASCGRNEPDYEDVADRALDGAGLQAAEADYDADAKVIHVTGTVTSEADRQRAGDVVSAAVGSGAQVANEVTVQGGHEETANDFDDAIETRLNNVVQLDAALKESAITFDAAEGVVTITGRVPTVAMKDRVGTLAKAEAGVRDVVNSLEVGPEVVAPVSRGRSCPNDLERQAGDWPQARRALQEGQPAGPAGPRS